MDFTDSFTNSCNCAFGIIAQKIGKEKLQLTAENLGFGESFKFGNGETAASIIDLSETEDGDLAWAGVGQYDTLVNPYHMLVILGAIANDGKAVLPFTVSQVATPDGKVVEKAIPETETYLTSETANKVTKIMRNTVENKYGDWNFKGLSMCGKTGTAEVSDSEKPHSWFVGFSQNESCPVAIAVIVENGGWGSSTALPIASLVMEEIYKSLS